MWPCMKLRCLEECLQQVRGFERPNISLEQYVTPPHLGAHMLFTIQSCYGDIQNKMVADLGSGCGALTIGAAVLEAGLVIGFEIDEAAINICNENIEQIQMFNLDVICCDVVKSLPSRFDKQFDTVLLNPPFGTKNNVGIDMAFLKSAFRLSRGVVYSLHKTSTRSHVLKMATSSNVKGEVLAQMRYDLPSSYKFHRKYCVDIDVDFFRFEVKDVSKK